MMGKQSKQIQMVILDIDSMIPEDHLLRQIKNCVNFDFIYEKAAPYYSHIGRKSIDPVILIKMLLIGYLYGIKSERRLEEEVSLNLAYRWFCGIDLTQRVPDHSTFSQNRRRRFQDAGIFREIFNEIVLQCIQLGIVSGETGVADGSFLPSNVSWNSRYEVVEYKNFGKYNSFSSSSSIDWRTNFLFSYKKNIAWLRRWVTDNQFSIFILFKMKCMLLTKFSSQV